jgi:hypothetical protein
VCRELAAERTDALTQRQVFMTGRMAAQRFGSDADAKLILQALSLNF